MNILELCTFILELHSKTCHDSSLDTYGQVGLYRPCGMITGGSPMAWKAPYKVAIIVVNSG
jgi:hypothetical protein